MRYANPNHTNNTTAWHDIPYPACLGQELLSRDDEVHPKVARKRAPMGSINLQLAAQDSASKYQTPVAGGKTCV